MTQKLTICQPSVFYPHPAVRMDVSVSLWADNDYDLCLLPSPLSIDDMETSTLESPYLTLRGREVAKRTPMKKRGADREDEGPNKQVLTDSEREKIVGEVETFVAEPLEDSVVPSPKISTEFVDGDVIVRTEIDGVKSPPLVLDKETYDKDYCIIDRFKTIQDCLEKIPAILDDRRRKRMIVEWLDKSIADLQQAAKVPSIEILDDEMTSSDNEPVDLRTEPIRPPSPSDSMLIATQPARTSSQRIARLNESKAKVFELIDRVVHDEQYRHADNLNDAILVARGISTGHPVRLHMRSSNAEDIYHGFKWLSNDEFISAVDISGSASTKTMLTERYSIADTVCKHADLIKSLGTFLKGLYLSKLRDSYIPAGVSNWYKVPTEIKNKYWEDVERMGVVKGNAKQIINIYKKYSRIPYIVPALTCLSSGQAGIPSKKDLITRYDKEYGSTDNRKIIHDLERLFMTGQLGLFA
jgi:hypothetical protein